MATLPVYNKSGEKVDSYEIESSEIAPKISKQLMHDAVVMYQANKRQGSACTKTRGEVAGASQKMYRQKGTGHARAGSRRSGVRRGGGHIFALKPRDYSYRLPKKSLKLATRMALASKIEDNELTLIDSLEFGAPKTKDMAAVLNALELNTTLLVAVAEHDVNVYKSVRNIPGVSVLPVADLNCLEVLRPKRVLMTKAALDAVRQQAQA